MNAASPHIQPQTQTLVPQIVAENLVQWFKIGSKRIEVLRGVSLQIAEGEKLFLCGASGAGKTTLLYNLAGLEKPAEGRVVVNGQSLYQCRSSTLTRLRNQRMGYVFQNYLLLPELTALENVLLPAMIDGRAGRQAAEQMLIQVGLADRLHHLPAELSGGEQQRVAIARALINQPDILFADEPTGNLDSKTGHEIMELILQIAHERRKTLIVVTHDTHLAQAGDRQLHLADGRIVGT